ncbi:MAG: hypothetical protein NTW80_04590 [Deltaproteobacteria bacterium]|nr:hypothetical protein [Deltaproteobacteria bacterium]
MKSIVGLMLLAALGLWGCAETTSRSEVVNRASMCAMCGASVGADYFYDTTNRSMGPTNR